MILVNSSIKKKKKYNKAHSSKSILSFKSLNSGSQKILLNFVILKDNTNVSSVSSFLFLLKGFEYIVLLTTEKSVSKLTEINSFH